MLRALIVAVAAGAMTPPVAAQAPTTRTLGDFPWDASTGSVLLQQVSKDRLVVQVRILAASRTSRGRLEARKLPTDAMEAWVLLDDGTALEQTPRQPPRGSPPVGVANAGDEYAFVTFGFRRVTRAEVAAVVVKIDAQYHLFPVRKG